MEMYLKFLRSKTEELQQYSSLPMLISMSTSVCFRQFVDVFVDVSARVVVDDGDDVDVDVAALKVPGKGDPLYGKPPHRLPPGQACDFFARFFIITIMIITIITFIPTIIVLNI